MSRDLGFISEENLKKHISNTIEKYGEKLESYDLRKFNRNTIDPIKLIFDKIVYRSSWEDIVNSEIFRQRDKSNNNDIGYFHQRIFEYIENCKVPENGQNGGWDVIYKKPEGIQLPSGDAVSTIYVEMKNKHNTMNSSSASKTYIKMQNQLLSDDDCACFLVEVIAKTSQNIKWETTVDKVKVSHKRIRRVSIDQFYEIVTGEKDAFLNLCLKLPEKIEGVVKNKKGMKLPEDTVLKELTNISTFFGEKSKELSMAMAVYFLGFSSYLGFNKYLNRENEEKDIFLKELYEYGKKE